MPYWPYRYQGKRISHPEIVILLKRNIIYVMPETHSKLMGNVLQFTLCFSTDPHSKSYTIPSFSVLQPEGNVGGIISFWIFSYTQPLGTVLKDCIRETQTTS
jgi:hypothetical protein